MKTKTLSAGKAQSAMLLSMIALLLATTVALAAAAGASSNSSLQDAGIVGTITHPGFHPLTLALDETRNRLFVYDGSNNTIYIYDATTLAELGSVATTLQGCYSMVVDESQGKFYAGSASAAGAYPKDNIAVIDTASGTLLKYLATMGQNLLAKDESLDVVYVASVGSGWKIDVATDAMTPIAGPYNNIYTTLAVNPVTHELFISNWSQNNGNFFIVDPDTLDVTSIPNMNGFGVAVNWIENKAYVSYCQSAGMEGVCIYDRDTGAINRLDTTNDSTYPLVFNPEVNRLYSNTEVNATATVFNGATDAFENRAMTSALVSVGVRNSTDNVYYADPDGTYVVNGATGEILVEYPAAGVSCSVCTSEILINQTTGLVYVINQSTDERVTVIQDGVITPPTCNVTSISMQGSVMGALAADDCRSPIRQTNYWEPFYADRYSINGVAGQQIRIVLNGSFSWEYLYLVDPSGNVIAESWSGCFEGPCIPPSPQGWFTLPSTGVYTIEVTTLYENVTGSYTLTLSKAPPLPTTMTTKSVGAQDGWVLESNETSNRGGTMNSALTTLRLGDDMSRKQYRSVLSFDTSPLPDTAVITKVTLKLKHQGIVGGGTPITTFQGFMADIKKGFFSNSANLQLADWQAAAQKTVGPFSPSLSSGWYTIDLTAAKAYVNKLATTGGGLTQIRLRFQLDDNNNAIANYLSLYSGNVGVASRPQLIIEYYVP